MPGYENWEDVPPVALFGAKTVKLARGGDRIPRHLQNVAVGADVLILWLDCDKEGACMRMRAALSWLHALAIAHICPAPRRLLDLVRAVRVRPAPPRISNLCLR